jgi:hypothetical protein
LFLFERNSVLHDVDCNHRVEKPSFRTYENLAVCAIDLKRLDMKPGAPKKVLAIQGGSEVVDVTGILK